MANALRYTFQMEGEDSSAMTFDNVDAANDILDLSGWDFTGLSPVYTLEDSGTTLVLTIDFGTDVDAQDAFHNNVKDTWPTASVNPGEEYLPRILMNAGTTGNKILKDENGTEKEK
jgi:hypothetical protein